MTIEAEYNYILGLCESDLARGKDINYTCPYCGMPLAPLFQRANYSHDDGDDGDDGDQKIYCLCCGQDGAF